MRACPHEAHLTEVKESGDNVKIVLLPATSFSMSGSGCARSGGTSDCATCLEMPLGVIWHFINIGLLSKGLTFFRHFLSILFDYNITLNPNQ